MIIIAPPVPVTMGAMEWQYILGWIDAQGPPIDLPPLVLELRSRIKRGMEP